MIWSRDKRVAYGLGTLLVLLWVPVFFFLNEALSSLVCEYAALLLRGKEKLMYESTVTVPPNPNTPGCFLASQKAILYVVFILIMGFETGKKIPRVRK